MHISAKHLKSTGLQVLCGKALLCIKALCQNISYLTCLFSETLFGAGFDIHIPDRFDGLPHFIRLYLGKGIEFDSLVEQPVYLIFMLASPPDKSDELRNLLS